jgi:ATP-dependent helicase/nuclease subunit B
MQQYTYKNDNLGGLSELPITFGTGLPLLLSSPAKLLMLLLDWIGSGYGRHALVNIFSSGVFDVNVDQRKPDGVMPPRRDRFGRLNVVNVIKNSGLTWQRRAYVPCLEKHAAFLKESRADNVNAAKAADWLIGFIADAFERIPEEDENGAVDVEALLSALKAIVKKYRRIFSAFDSQGLKVAIYELNTTIKGRRARLSDAIEIIKEHMRDIRIMCESPAPGKMHFTTYRQAEWIERENVFMVGLGAGCFPGMAIEDPLILDHERMEPMVTSAQRINRNIGIMHGLLESFTGSLTCSYSSFDTVENRECFPATLFHRLREITGDKAMSHSGFIMKEPERFVDENDFWLHKGVNLDAFAGGGEQGQPEVPDAPMWKSAEHMAEKVLSASSLANFLSCKHKFFLKNILRLQEIKDQGYDTLGWLSNLETGTVYHTIFEKFLCHAKDNPEILLSGELAIKGITGIAEAEIARCEDELPTASNYHTERQRDEVLENAARFALDEVERASERTVYQVEMPFGSGEPLVINLGEGKMIKASGFIDRIDIAKDGGVMITDYKTGRKGQFESLQDPRIEGITEANAQLVLYYLALKEIARTSDEPELVKLQDVTSMSYHFVTAKGDYDIVTMHVDDDSEACYKAALVELVDEIEKGQFPPEKGAVRLDGKEKEPNCRYCGYKAVCAYAPDAG